MWFDDEEVSGRRRFKGKRTLSRNPILNVNVYLSDKRRARAYRVGVIVLLPTLIIAVGALLWFGLRSAGELLFSENDRFIITNLDIKGGVVITSDLIREYTQISEGMNLFGFDISKVRQEFLQRAPNVKSIKIIRYLPDTLKIEVIERVPLAAIGRRGYLVADSEGCVFGLRTRSRTMPVITGYSSRGLRPGSKIQGMGLAAIEVLDICESPEIGLRVVHIDVGNRKFLIVYLSNGKLGRLAWDSMGEMTEESRRKLLVKLHEWKRALQTESGMGSKEFDLTFAGRIYGR